MRLSPRSCPSHLVSHPSIIEVITRINFSNLEPARTPSSRRRVRALSWSRLLFDIPHHAREGSSSGEFISCFQPRHVSHTFSLCRGSGYSFFDMRGRDPLASSSSIFYPELTGEEPSLDRGYYWPLLDMRGRDPRQANSLSSFQPHTGESHVLALSRLLILPPRHAREGSPSDALTPVPSSSRRGGKSRLVEGIS